MAHHHDHHGHTHTPTPGQANSMAFVIGICLNLAFVFAEVIGGLLYGSMALLTDAGHNASDVASLVISLLALWMARKKSNAVFTYGFKKTTVLAALANAVLLLIAIGILGYESVIRLFQPEQVDGGVVAWIAGAGILVNGVSAMLFFRSQKHELNARSAYLHLLSDMMVSVGVVIAGVIMYYTHLYWIDPVIGLLIMVIILINTWGLLRDSFRMTIDAVPSGITLEGIKNIMLKVENVKKVSHVHVWPLSTTENALTAHIMVADHLLFNEKLAVVARVRHELEHHQIHHSTIELSNSEDECKTADNGSRDERLPASG